MSIIIALIIILIVSGLIAKFYPHPKKIEVIEEKPTWNFDNHIVDLAPEATPDPTVVAAINEQVKKPVSKNKAKVKPLAKMEAKKKPTKKPTKK